MVMHASAGSRASRASAGAILIVGALAALPVLQVVPARCGPSREADLGFLMPTTTRGAATGGALMGGRVNARRSPAVLLRAEVGDFNRGDAVTGKVVGGVNRDAKFLLIEVPGLSRTAIAFKDKLEKYPREYELGEEFVAKVYSADPKRSLSLTQRPLDRESKPERMAAKFKLGDIGKMLNQQVEGIVTSAPPFGLFIDIGVADRDALAPKVYLPDGKLPKDFTPGQKVQCWIVAVDEAKMKVIVSLTGVSDFKRGDVICGKVASKGEASQGEFLLIEVPGLSWDAIAFPNNLEKYLGEYEVGEEFVAKVHSFNREKNSLKLTQRPLDLGSEPERMAAKFEIRDVSQMLNGQMEGVVMNVAPFGIFLDIGVADKNALAPRIHLPDGKLPKDFTPGQKVPCWVVAVDEAEMKMTVSLVAPPEGGFPQPS